MSDDRLVTMFQNSDGHLQIVTEGPDSKCPTCGYPERHRIFEVPDDPKSKIADGCPSCETARVAKEERVMTDQKLVNELEKALTDEAYDGGIGALDADQFRELVRTLAVTAAEVVEKAHTPTDDEQEALSEASRRLSEALDPDMRDGWTVLPDDLLADFRAVMAATRRWKAEPFAPDWDMDAAASRVKAREEALLSEPQGEPSDAQVDAAARAINPEAWRAYDDPRADNRDMIVTRSRNVARAALRAAGGVR